MHMTHIIILVIQIQMLLVQKVYMPYKGRYAKFRVKISKHRITSKLELVSIKQNCLRYSH